MGGRSPSGSGLPMDPLTEWLAAEGWAPEVYQPAAFLGAKPIGWSVRLGQSRLVYRIPPESPDTLVIVLFERVGDRSGLRSPFADFARFIWKLRGSPIPIRRITGLVDAVSDRPEDSLVEERIAAFYQRHLAAGIVVRADGVEWVEGAVPSFEPPLSSCRAAGGHEQGADQP